MGAMISVGIVFENSEREHDFVDVCSRLVDLLNKRYGTSVIQDIKDPNPNFQSQVVLSPLMYKGRGLSTNIRIINDKDFNGILLDYSEELLIPTYTEATIYQAEQFIIDLMIEAYRHVRFSYGFCDHEAEIEHSPSAFFHLGKAVYSLEFIPADSQLVVRKSNWHINGLTERKN